MKNTFGAVTEGLVHVYNSVAWLGYVEEIQCGVHLQLLKTSEVHVRPLTQNWPSSTAILL